MPVSTKSFDHIGTIPDALSAVQTAIDTQKANKINQYYPDKGPLRRELYPKHCAIMAAGKTYRTRGVVAGNRLGKTIVGVFETVLHLTGNYPDWWTGHRFKKPIKAWVAGDTSKTTKEILQDKLLGQVGDFGTGMLPKASIVRTTSKAGIADAVDTIFVKHISGGTSVCSLKSFDQKRESFQGTEQDWIHLDEEPDESIFTECVLRTMATGSFEGGRILLTFTPINGWTDLVDQFLNEERREQANRYVMTLAWDDAPHLTKAEKDDLFAQIPEYQRKARVYGIPELGSGAIYPLDDSEIVVEPFEIPDHWPRAFGMDVGGKTAASWVAHDRDTDTIYLYSEYYREKAEPSIHATGIKSRGVWIPGWCDPAANQSSQIDGRKLLDMYKELGLNLRKADNAVESGIARIYERMSTGRFKVFASCKGFLEERRKYRRDMKGKIVKQGDHLCFVAGTLIRTPNGNVPIERLSTNDLVSTPLGSAKVLGCGVSSAKTILWNGTRVTPEHPVFSFKNGWTRVDALRYTDSICEWNPSFLTALRLGATRTQKTSAMHGILGRVPATINTIYGIFIEKSGKLTTDLYQRAMMFTTRTIIQATTIFPTWRYCLNLTTIPCMENYWNGTQNILPESGHSHSNGIDLKKDVNGMLNTALRLTQNASLETISANNVEQISNPSIIQKNVLCSVLITVSRLGVVRRVLTMFPGIARFVVKNSLSTSTLKKAPVANPALESFEKVYSLRTEHGCYFANDVLVSNCDALRYVCNAPLNSFVAKVVSIRKAKEEPWQVYGGGRSVANGWMAN